jgi:hypothetical protein
MSAAEVQQTILGSVLETSGGRAICRLDLATLAQNRNSTDPARLSASSVGGIVKIAVADALLVGTLTELKADRENQKMLLAEVEFIGEGSAGPDGDLASFRRGVTVYPLPDDTLMLATRADIEQIFSPRDVPHIDIGTVHPTTDVRAAVFLDNLLSRHFAVVGASGTGKSTTVTLLLNRIIAAAPQSHVVILDPHGEYPRAFGPRAKVWDVDNLKIPYWLMSLEEHCEAFIASTGESRAVDVNIMAKCLAKARARNLYNDDGLKITADSPIAYRLGDLTGALNEESGRLEKEAEAHHYTRLRLNIEQFFADRRYHFIFNESHQGMSMPQFLGELLRIPVDGAPVSIVDLAGVPSQIAKVVVSILSRLILDYAVWTRTEQRVPVLLVCEEAHRYLPHVHAQSGISAERQLDRIAREGRKYGVSLGLITQRPSELSETALSQCGTIIAMRLNNVRDQAQVQAILSEGSRNFVEIIPALQNRECIISGEGVPVPMRVRLDTLEADLRPASDDPVYSSRWRSGDHGEAMLTETVRRWREQGAERSPAHQLTGVASAR